MEVKLRSLNGSSIFGYLLILRFYALLEGDETSHDPVTKRHSVKAHFHLLSAASIKVKIWLSKVFAWRSGLVEHTDKVRWLALPSLTANRSKIQPH